MTCSQRSGIDEMERVAERLGVDLSDDSSRGERDSHHIGEIVLLGSEPITICYDAYFSGFGGK